MDLISEEFDRAFNEVFYVPVKEECGFVAFMDILGFSNIKRSSKGFRSSDEKAIGVIFGMMNDALSEKEELIRSFDPRFFMSDEEMINVKKEEIESIKKDQHLARNNISLTIISDSLICLADIKDKSVDEASFITSTFFQLISNLATTMFKRGLPLRGGVSFGQFFSYSNLNNHLNAFLGEALINAHTLEMAADSASIYLDESAELKCKELYRPWHWEKSINEWMNLCIADIALKQGGDKKRPCINLQQIYQYRDEYELYVKEVFSDHGKCEPRNGNIESNNNVMRKVKNTVRYLESRNVWTDVYGMK